MSFFSTKKIGALQYYFLYLRTHKNTEKYLM